MYGCWDCGATPTCRDALVGGRLHAGDGVQIRGAAQIRGDLEVAVPEGDAVEGHAVGGLLHAAELQERKVLLLRHRPAPAPAISPPSHPALQTKPGAELASARGTSTSNGTHRSINPRDPRECADLQFRTVACKFATQVHTWSAVGAPTVSCSDTVGGRPWRSQLSSGSQHQEGLQVSRPRWSSARSVMGVRRAGGCRDGAGCRGR